MRSGYVILGRDTHSIKIKLHAKGEARIIPKKERGKNRISIFGLVKEIKCGKILRKLQFNN